METLGETTFADYLRQTGLPVRFEEGRDGRQRRPDFTLDFEGVTCFFDVKDRTAAAAAEDVVDLLDAEDAAVESAIGNACTEEAGADAEDDEGVDLDFEAVSGGAGDPPYRWIREQIEQGRRKFREFKDCPCAIVLFDTIGRSWDMEHPAWVLGAMYGDAGILMRAATRAGALDTGEPRAAFLRGGKMFRPSTRLPQNTTISALLTLRRIEIGKARLLRYLETIGAPDFAINPELASEIGFDPNENQLGVIVWENVYARTPLPRSLFRGRYDERWESHGSRVGRAHVGERLAEFYAAYDSPGLFREIEQ